jgi:hypothetical protein
MYEHGAELPDPESRPREFGSAKGWIHMADDFDAPLLSEPALADSSEGGITPALERAIRAAKALSAEDQDALAAEILEWIEDERRWAESFARTHEALAELADEALAEHHAGETLACGYAEMAEDEAREAEATEWSEGLVADAADDPDESRSVADG